MIYPQWQGADIARWIPELAPEDASRGYYLGSMLLEFLAPKSDCETFRIPVSTDISNRIVSDGVLDHDILELQTKAALDTLKIANPDKVYCVDSGRVYAPSGNTPQTYAFGSAAIIRLSLDVQILQLFPGHYKLWNIDSLDTLKCMLVGKV